MRSKGFLFLLTLTFVAACHPRITPEIAAPKSNAEHLLARLYNRNQDLKTFKGIGSIRIWDAAGSQRARIAWLGDVDGRLRVEILGPSGRPLMKVAYDGECLYFYSIDSNGVHKRRARNPSLVQVIDIPVTIKELLYFLSGRFPIYDHGRVELIKAGAAQPDELVLKRFLRGAVEKIALTTDHSAVVSVKIYEWQGLAYQASLSEYQQRNGFSIPGRITLNSDDAAGLEIRINRYWPNVEIQDQQFVVTPA